MTSPSWNFLLDSHQNNDTALCLFLSFDAADDDTIVQWTNFMGFAPGLTCDVGLTLRCAGVRLGS